MDEIIRKWDTVKIVKPEFFVRCGYPLTFEDVSEEIEKKYENHIMGFINQITKMESGRSIDNQPAFNEINRALTYHLLRSKRFGGSKRTIYTESIPNPPSEILTVVGIKFVKTGTYVDDSNASVDGYYPAYLSKQKTHKILTIGDNEWYADIEADNVEKINELKRVKFIGCDKMQISWGSHDNPNRLLSKRKTYRVFTKEVHASYTAYRLVGFEDLRFNSVCFKEAK